MTTETKLPLLKIYPVYSWHTLELCGLFRTIRTPDKPIIEFSLQDLPKEMPLTIKAELRPDDLGRMGVLSFHVVFSRMITRDVHHFISGLVPADQFTQNTMHKHENWVAIP